MTKVNIKLLKGAEAINNSITSIGRRGKSLDKDTHVTALSILQHAEDHGDVTLATRLVDTVSAGMRRNSLIKWFETFGIMTYQKVDKKKGIETAGFKVDRKKKTDMEKAMVTPYYDKTFKVVEGADYSNFEYGTRAKAMKRDMLKAKEAGVKISQQALNLIEELIELSAKPVVDAAKKEAA